QQDCGYSEDWPELSASCNRRNAGTQSFQVRLQLLGGLVPMSWFFLQALQDDSFQLGRQRRSQAAWRAWSSVNDVIRQSAWDLLFERSVSSGYLIEHCSCSPNVGARFGGLTTQLFGCHVGQCPGDFLGLGQRRGHADFARVGHQLCEPEVEDFQPTIGSQPQIRGLEIAMHNAVLVGGA